MRTAAALGFSLAEIRGLLALRVSSKTSCETVRERAAAKIADVDARIAELTRVREALAQLVATCTYDGKHDLATELIDAVEDLGCSATIDDAKR